MPGHKKNNKCIGRLNRSGLGFTLIEVLFAGSVTAILVALLLPAMGYVNHMARTAQGLSNLSQIAKGMRVYSFDHNNTLPMSYYETSGVLITDWTVEVTKYISQGSETIATVPGSTNTLAVFRCPNATTPFAGRTHYSTHPVLFPDRSDIAGLKHDIYSLTWMRRPSEIMMVMDGAQRPPTAKDPYTTFMTTTELKDSSGKHVIEDVFADYDDNATDNDAAITKGPNIDDGTETTPGKGVGDGTIRWRQHRNQAANFVFGDGHAATLRPEQVKNRNIRVDR